MYIHFFEEQIKAGFPSPASGTILSSLDLNELLIVHPTATFFIRVEGDSMEGAKIFSGDLMIVDRALTPKNGSVIVALLNGEFTVKRLVKEGPKITLRAENPKYRDIEVREGSDFQVWGVVTNVIHKLF